MRLQWWVRALFVGLLVIVAHLQIHLLSHFPTTRNKSFLSSPSEDDGRHLWTSLLSFSSQRETTNSTQSGRNTTLFDTALTESTPTTATDQPPKLEDSFCPDCVLKRKHKLLCQSRVEWLMEKYNMTRHSSIRMVLKEEPTDCKKKNSHLDMMQVIAMGLPKTGTTATAVALQKLGLRVSHDNGDVLYADANGSPTCNVLSNTLENKYHVLHESYPQALWMVTYSRDVKAWFNSVQAHNKHKWEKYKIRRRYLPCHFYGCEKGSNHTLFQLTETNEVLPNETDLVMAAYKNYYAGLFSYLQRHNISYAHVDVRANVYRRVQEIIHPDLTTPFASKNTRHHRGDYPRCP